MLTPVRDRFEIANDAYVSGDFVKAKIYLDGIIDEAPTSPYGIGARYLRARGFEDGFFSNKPEFKMAYEDFLIVKEHSDRFGSDGALGCARVLYEIDAKENKNRIISLCLEAIKQDKNVKAMMLLGRAYDEIFLDGEAARKWYLKAFCRGLPWGMRFYARSHANAENHIRAAIGHGLATVSSPFLVFANGARSPFK